MTKWIKNILGIIIVVFLLWYLSAHWDKIKVLPKLSPTELMVIYLVNFLGVLNIVYITQRLLNTLGAKTSFWDMVLLQNATYLLNYVPMKFGTVFRANYLKRHYGLSYACFGTFFVYLMLLIAIAAATVGLVALVTVCDIAKYETKILALAFLSVLACSSLLAFIPLPIPTGFGKLSTTIRSFLKGRRDVTGNKRTLFVCTAFFVGNFILTSVRLGIIYNSMGQNIHPAGYLVLGAMGYVTMFVSLTPGALGIRELVLGSAAMALGVSFEVGVLAAMVDRAIALSWCFTIGSACTAWLWHKSPADFKKEELNSLSEN